MPKPSNMSFQLLLTSKSICTVHFSAAGPRVWNTLAQELRQDTSFGLFRRKLKSLLFV